MKMSKRALSFFLTLIMAFQCCNFAFAISTDDTTKYDQPEEGDTTNEVDCNKFTITFEHTPKDYLSARGDSIMLNSFPTSKQYEAATLAHNADATNEAKRFVESLNLSESDYGFIEESCISQLDDLSKNSNFALTSYSVLVPKSLNSTNNKHVPFEDLTYYGTYAGNDYYYYFYSEVDGTVNYRKTSTRAKEWFKRTVELILCFGDARITVPYTLVLQSMNNPYGYEPNSKAYCDYCFNVNIRTRGIYTKHTAIPSMKTVYSEVTSGQIGQLYPGIVYYPVESPKYNVSYSINLGYRGNVYTPFFKDKDTQLREANNANLGGISIHRKVMDYPSSYYWGT